MDYAVDNGLPRRYQLLLGDPKGTSDDEKDPDSNVYHIKKKLGRSDRTEAFIRLIDDMRMQSARFLGKHKTERVRVIPAVQKASRLLVLPDKVPLDYYDVDFYNSLPLSVRRGITPDNPLIALHSDNEKILCSPRDKSEKMSDANFMKAYGNAILEQYHVPGSDDGVESEEGGQEGLADGEAQMEDPEMPLDEVTEQQAAFADRMDQAGKCSLSLYSCAG